MRNITIVVLVLAFCCLCVGQESYQRNCVINSGSIAVTNSLSLDASGSTISTTNLVGVQLKNANDNALFVNPQARTLVVMNHALSEILEGNGYAAKGWTDIPTSASGGNVVFAFVSTNCLTEDPHVSFKFDFETEMTLVAYRNATISTNGTAVTITNNRLGCTNTPCLKIYSSSSISDYGTEFWNAKGGSRKNVTGTASDDNEWIFDYADFATSNVVLIVSNAATQTSWFDYHVWWHEHEDYTD
jgi:hypothetical protein